VVDGRVAVTGGINLGHVYEKSCRRARLGIAPPARNVDDACWADVALRIEGPAVSALQRLFLEQWARQRGPTLPARAWFPPPTRLGETLLRVVGSAPGYGEPSFYVARMAAIARAQHRVWLASGYFVPTPRECRELARAARRGLDVRLLLAGANDQPLVKTAQQSFYEPMLTAGVRVMELWEAVLHAKVGLIDGTWSAIGSSNLDRRSVAWNDEVDVIVQGSEIGAALEASMARVMAQAVPVSLEQWRERGIGQRLQEVLTWPLQDLL
jgi:cardiolipin synthase